MNVWRVFTISKEKASTVQERGVASSEIQQLPIQNWTQTSSIFQRSFKEPWAGLDLMTYIYNTLQPIKGPPYLKTLEQTPYRSFSKPLKQNYLCCTRQHHLNILEFLPSVVH